MGSNNLSVIEQTIDSSINSIDPIFRQSVIRNNYSLVVDDQLLAAKRQVMKSNYAMTCVTNSPLHFQDAVKTAGILGVDLTESKKQGWLIPRLVKIIDAQGRERKTPVIQFQVGYKGVEAIHQRLGVIKRLFVRVVRENDDFDWSGDDTEKPNHKANWFDSEESRGEIKGAYCITYFPDNSLMVTSAGIDEINTKHRDKSDSWKNERNRKYSPWSTFPEQMVLKTIVFIAAKQFPAYKMSENNDTSRIIQTLHETDTDDYQDIKQIPHDGRFNGFLMTSNAVGMFLLHKEYLNGNANFDLDDENGKAWVNLFQNLPDGFKGKIRDEVDNLIEKGQSDILDIEDCLNSDDPSVVELVDFMDRECKKMLVTHLGKDDTDKLKNLVSANV